MEFRFQIYILVYHARLTNTLFCTQNDKNKKVQDSRHKMHSAETQATDVNINFSRIFSHLMVDNILHG